MSVIYCLNPYCENPLNDTKTRKCRCCQSNLILHKRYVAIKKIGKGGFGTTYLAVDMADKNSYCVIKQLEPAKENPQAYKTALNLFNREAKTLAKLDHAQIPKLLNYFEENQQFYLIQEFVLGRNLERLVRKGRLYQESLAKKFLRSMLPVLQYIHSQKVIHRDIKPGNILREKTSKVLYLIDFGAVKEQVSTQLMNENPDGAFTKISVGTMGFAPPEQLAMRPVYSSDIYALAATCVFLLTGKAPKDLCDPVTGELAWEQYTAVTPTFARVLNKMLELDVRKRYTSADEVIKALDLVPYEEELAGSMVNLKSAKDTLSLKTIPEKQEENPSFATTSNNLADAIRRRREKLKNLNNPSLPNIKSVPSIIPPSQPRLKLTPELIVQHYKQGDRNFSQQSLNRFNLESLNLAGASFSQSKLIGSTFEKGNLYRTNFYNANLAQANLRDVNLGKAELYKANLKSADLQGANLAQANLTDAILRDANLSGANLEGAKVTDEQLRSAKTNWRTIFPDGKRRWW